MLESTYFIPSLTWNPIMLALYLNTPNTPFTRAQSPATIRFTALTCLAMVKLSKGSCHRYP